MTSTWGYAFATLAAIVLTVTVATPFDTWNAYNTPAQNSDSIQRVGIIHVEHIRDGEVVNEYTKRNLVTDNGLDWIRSQVSAVDDTGVDTDESEYIALGNGTAPTASTTQLDQEITDSGLSRTQGSTYAESTTGNFSVFNTFTATSSTTVTVNTTSLNWNSSGPSIVSGSSFAESLPMQNNDQLNVTHTIAFTNN